MSEYQKLACEQFVEKVAQIEAKEHKNDPANVSR